MPVINSILRVEVELLLQRKLPSGEWLKLERITDHMDNGSHKNRFELFNSGSGERWRTTLAKGRSEIEKIGQGLLPL